MAGFPRSRGLSGQLAAPFKDLLWKREQQKNPMEYIFLELLTEECTWDPDNAFGKARRSSAFITSNSLKTAKFPHHHLPFPPRLVRATIPGPK